MENGHVEYHEFPTAANSRNQLNQNTDLILQAGLLRLGPSLLDVTQLYWDPRVFRKSCLKLLNQMLMPRRQYLQPCIPVLHLVNHSQSLVVNLSWIKSKSFLKCLEQSSNSYACKFDIHMWMQVECANNPKDVCMREMIYQGTYVWCHKYRWQKSSNGEGGGWGEGKAGIFALTISHMSHQCLSWTEHVWYIWP